MIQWEREAGIRPGEDKSKEGGSDRGGEPAGVGGNHRESELFLRERERTGRD